MWSKAIGAASVLRGTATAIFLIGVRSGPAGASGNASSEGVPSLATFRDHRRRQEGHSDQRDRRPVQHRHAQADRVLSRARFLSAFDGRPPPLWRFDDVTLPAKPLAPASQTWPKRPLATRERERERDWSDPIRTKPPHA
jgi:hypothetical protein